MCKVSSYLGSAVVILLLTHPGQAAFSGSGPLTSHVRPRPAAIVPAEIRLAQSTSPDYDEAQMDCEMSGDEGTCQKALTLINTAIKRHPGDPKAYANRASVYAALDDAQSAIRDYSTAIELQPDNLFHYYFRAQVHESLGHNALAIADYKKSLELIGDNPDLRRPAEEALRRLGAAN